MKVAIIGAGVAGMFVALNLKNCDVTVYERNANPGVKLNITGKGRCNITNDCSNEEFLANVVTNPRFMFSAINTFSPSDTIDFFAKNNLELVTERGNRVFPKSKKASDVSACLYGSCKRNKVKFVFNKVIKVAKSVEEFIVHCENSYEFYDKVVVCCGGASYPETGSDGNGYEIAKTLSHSITELRPALVPIETKQNVSILAGLNLRNVKLSAICGKKTFTFFGEVEFFKKGLCGPTVLSLSSMLNKCDLSQVEISLDLKPALDRTTLDKRILREINDIKSKTVYDVIKTLLPLQMIDYYLSYCKVSPQIETNSLTKVDRASLINGLKDMKFTIKKLVGVDRGIVTCGGVSVKEINPKTMMSKLVDGLYFAGEIIDVDALTGGYNIQIALSTAYAVASAINNERRN